MVEAMPSRYWCHVCTEVVYPDMEVEIKCPFCGSGFVEDMSGGNFDINVELRSQRAFSQWAPVLLGMMGGSSRRSRYRREEDGDDLDREFEEFIRRRRRRSAVRQLLQSIRDNVRPDTDDPENERTEGRVGERGRESAFLINAFNQAMVIREIFGSDGNDGGSNNPRTGNSLEDYFVGPGLDLLLQHLSENDPNRHGTPPAKKEAVEALPTVKIEDSMSCSICLDDFEIGSEARQMPCKHKFHGQCILPWLELHSSCPVCRFQLPVNEPKESSGSADGDRMEGSNEDAAGGDGSGGRSGSNRSWVLVPWPFGGLFSSSSGSQNAEGSSSSSSTPSASGSRSNTEERGS